MNRSEVLPQEVKENVNDVLLPLISLRLNAEDKWNIDSVTNYSAFIQRESHMSFINLISIYSKLDRELR